MEKHRMKDLLLAVKDQGQDTLIEHVVTYGPEFVKDTFPEFIGEVSVDATFSMLPGVSGVYSGYKRRRFESNMRKTFTLLENRMEEITKGLINKTEEQTKQINLLFGYVLDYIAEEPQEQKIEFLINGYINLLEHERITEDFVFTYYDVMDSLRIVDLAVLKLYNQISYYDQGNKESYVDVMERHGLSRDQYIAIQNNLFRIGLLETQTDQELEKDLKEVFDGLNAVNDYLIKLAKGKGARTNKIKKLKMRSKDRFKITRFGREFYLFFVEKDD